MDRGLVPTFVVPWTRQTRSPTYGRSFFGFLKRTKCPCDAIRKGELAPESKRRGGRACGTPAQFPSIPELQQIIGATFYSTKNDGRFMFVVTSPNQLSAKWNGGAAGSVLNARFDGGGHVEANISEVTLPVKQRTDAKYPYEISVEVDAKLLTVPFNMELSDDGSLWTLTFGRPHLPTLRKTAHRKGGPEHSRW